jgi:hypothetical protein
MAMGYSIEAGIIAGLIFAAIGAALLVSGVMLWEHAGFGNLSYPDSLRIVIPGVTLVVLGVQTISNGFIFHILLRTHS